MLDRPSQQLSVRPRRYFGYTELVLIAAILGFSGFALLSNGKPAISDSRVTITEAMLR